LGGGSEFGGGSGGRSEVLPEKSVVYVTSGVELDGVLEVDLGD
jgi:hypothetical protein